MSTLCGKRCKFWRSPSYVLFKILQTYLKGMSKILFSMPMELQTRLDRCTYTLFKRQTCTTSWKWLSRGITRVWKVWHQWAQESFPKQSTRLCYFFKEWIDKNLGEIYSNRQKSGTGLLKFVGRKRDTYKWAWKWKISIKTKGWDNRKTQEWDTEYLV